MTSMGRQRSRNFDLPPRMYPRRLKSKTLYYYGKARIPLGDDLAKAKEEWAKLENGHSGGFVAVSEAFERKYLPDLSPKTQKEYKAALRLLREAYGHFSLEEIEPFHVKQYVRERSAKVSAQREMAVLSVLFNWARGEGYTSTENPCIGIQKGKKSVRRVYVRDEDYRKAWERAPDWLKDAMDLALLTSQRPSDVLKMTRHDLHDGFLWVDQGKTKERLRVRVEGELKVVLDRIKGRARKIDSLYLIADESGQKVSIWRLDKAFAKAREGNWQFRDLRAKAITDEKDLRTASDRAGHRDEVTTAAVYRRVKGREVGPLK